VNGISEDFKPTLAKGLRLVAFLVLPSTIGLVLLSEPIVSVLYERRAFGAFDRAQTAGALQAYGYGLLFYAWLKVLQPAFYAIEKRWLPMMMSFVALGLNLGFNYLFVFVLKWGHESLAMTTSIVAGVNFLSLYIAMGRFAGDVGTPALLKVLAKILVAGSAMGAVCWAANTWVLKDPTHMNLLTRCAALGATIGVAAVVYFAMARLLLVAEAQEALSMVTRRLKR
jgi:putative peptidoglycan lipid II flippase